MPSMNRFICTTLSLLALSAAARAETTDCTVIASVPYSIAQPGVFCLKSTVSGTAGIDIASSDVVLDLNGHTLEAPMIGVHSSIPVMNVVVRNGIIRSDTHAVHLQAVAGAGHLVVEGIRAEGSVKVSGNGSAVRNNVVTGASKSGGGTIRYAIEVSDGTGIRVSDNTVVNPALPTVNDSGGIRVIGGIGAVVERNAISGTTLQAAPRNRGILLQLSRGAVVTGNHVASMEQGIVNTTTANPVLFRDNTVQGAVTPYQGGVLAGMTNQSF